MWKTLFSIVVVAIAVASAVSVSHVGPAAPRRPLAHVGPAAPRRPIAHVGPAVPPSHPVKAQRNCHPPFSNINGLTGCYYFNENMGLNWLRSAEYCRSIGGNLLTIDNYLENSVIRSHLAQYHSKASFYAGGYDIDHEGSWYWQASLSPMDFFDWAAKQPDNLNGDENCLALEPINAFHWNDRPCTLTNFGFICEA